MGKDASAAEHGIVDDVVKMLTFDLPKHAWNDDISREQETVNSFKDIASASRNEGLNKFLIVERQYRRSRLLDSLPIGFDANVYDLLPSRDKLSHDANRWIDMSF